MLDHKRVDSLRPVEFFRSFFASFASFADPALLFRTRSARLTPKVRQAASRALLASAPRYANAAAAVTISASPGSTRKAAPASGV